MTEEVTKPRKARASKADKKARAPKAAKTAKPKTEGATKSVVDPKYLAKYSASDVKTASGKRKSFDVGDRLAAKLRGKDVAALIGIAKDNGIEVPKNIKERNPGMARMALGNAFRGFVRKGNKLTVDGQTIASL